MPEFELTFEVSALSGRIEDAIVDTLDAVIATHHGVTTVTTLSAASDCLGAARSVVSTLRRLGAVPLRLVDDLVTRGQIAERAGVTRQAVGQWIRGERHSGTAFPAPFILAGGGLWRWGEVVDALAARGTEIDAGTSFPSRRDAQLIGGMLAAAGSVSPWSKGIDMGRHFAVTPGVDPGMLFVSAPDSVRGDFTLSA